MGPAKCNFKHILLQWEHRYDTAFAAKEKDHTENIDNPVNGNVCCFPCKSGTRRENWFGITWNDWRLREVGIVGLGH